MQSQIPSQRFFSQLASLRTPVSFARMRRLLAFVLALGVACARADSPSLTIRPQRIPSPAPVHATAPLLVSVEQTVSLAWLESGPDDTPRVFTAAWSHTAGRWAAPQPAPQLSSEAFLDHASARVRFPDGSGLSVFFPQAGDRILDLHTQRHHSSGDAPPRALSQESWPARKQPPEPSALAAHEARVIAVWLNHAENSPRLLAARSTNAGDSFFLPVRIDDGRPLGRAASAMLRDGSAYVIWLEADSPEKATAALWLRRLSPAGALSVPVRLATGLDPGASDRPRLALLKDYDATSAQLLVAYTLTTDGIRQIVTQLITLPPEDTFTQDRGCLTCPADEDTQPGHALLGKITRLLPETRQVVLTHEGVPGILPAGTHLFHCDDDAWRALSGASRLYARIERRDGAWWLSDIRALQTPGPP
jgi:hypothetical protein